MRRATAALVATACVLLASNCGGDEPEDADASSGATTSSPSETTPAELSPSDQSSESTQPSSPATEDAGRVIEITFEGDDVTPNGDRVKVRAGEPIELRVTADAPGEIHVHSNPEQQLKYETGESTLSLTIDQPGITEVESHELEKIIVQLEVRP